MTNIDQRRDTPDLRIEPFETTPSAMIDNLDGYWEEMARELQESTREEIIRNVNEGCRRVAGDHDHWVPDGKFEAGRHAKSEIVRTDAWTKPVIEILNKDPLVELDNEVRDFAFELVAAAIQGTHSGFDFVTESLTIEGRIVEDEA